MQVWPPLNSLPVSGKAGIAVSAAYSQLGVPYRFATSSPGVSFDCSGLTKWAWGRAGVGMPHQRRAAQHETSAIGADDLEREVRATTGDQLERERRHRTRDVGCQPLADRFDVDALHERKP